MICSPEFGNIELSFIIARMIVKFGEMIFKEK